jgi:hypothetical protein
MIIWDDDSFWEPRWGRKYPAYDKLGHFVCHFFASFLTTRTIFACQPPVLSDRGVRVIGALLWFVIGWGYEFIWDVYRGRRPSWRDIIANGLGNILGAMLA